MAMDARQPVEREPKDEETTGETTRQPGPVFAAWLGSTNEVTRTFLGASRIQGLVNLGGGLPEPAVYPVAEIAELAHRAVSEHPRDCLNYAPIEGLPALRDAIARRLSTPALPLTRQNVLITSGGMQALDLLGKVFLDIGSPIAAQSPAYVGALDAWRPRQPVYRPMALDAGPADFGPALDGARFAYAVPNFSNPTGHLVDLPTRQALLAAATAHGTPLVEDDPYGALHYDAAPLPRMLTLSATGTPSYEGPVVYLGTLSKEVAPGLRVGWVVAAPPVIEALVLAKQGSDLATSGLSQRIALDALEAGLLERALPTILDVYRTRRDALLAALERHMAEWFTWERPVGGMFVWVRAKDPGFDTDALLKTGLANGVCISPGSVFDPLEQDRRSVRINFTANDPERLEEGVARLAKATRALLAAAG